MPGEAMRKGLYTYMKKTELKVPTVKGFFLFKTPLENGEEDHVKDKNNPNMLPVRRDTQLQVIQKYLFLNELHRSL